MSSPALEVADLVPGPTGDQSYCDELAYVESETEDPGEGPQAQPADRYEADEREQPATSAGRPARLVGARALNLRKPTRADSLPVGEDGGGRFGNGGAAPGPAAPTGLGSRPCSRTVHPKGVTDHALVCTETMRARRHARNTTRGS
jgi:hypothetical protein